MNNHDDSTTEVPIAGMAVADFVFRVPAIPTEAEKYRADSMEIVVGGQAANAAIAVARLGGRAVLSTRLGEDGVADAVRGDLESEGVDCRIRRAGRSPLSAVAVDAAGERQIVNFRGAALAEEPEPIGDLAPAAVLVDASTQPADPAPTTMKSNLRSCAMTLVPPGFTTHSPRPPTRARRHARRGPPSRSCQFLRECANRRSATRPAGAGLIRYLRRAGMWQLSGRPIEGMHRIQHFIAVRCDLQSLVDDKGIGKAGVGVTV